MRNKYIFAYLSLEGAKWEQGEKLKPINCLILLRMWKCDFLLLSCSLTTL